MKLVDEASGGENRIMSTCRVPVLVRHVFSENSASSGFFGLLFM